MVQTSLIPAVTALSEFFRLNFPDIFWYPHWYSGNPYNFLIGPIVPALLAIFNSQFSIFNKFSMTQIYLGIIGGSFIIGSFGIYFFLRDWGIERKQAILSAMIYLILPGSFFLLQFQNGLNHLSINFLPYALLIYKRFLEKDSNKLLFSLVFIITFVLLINVYSIPAFIIGFIALFVSKNLKNESDNFIDKILKTFLVFILAFFLATIWYTPRFWWVLLSNPSLGGIPLFNLFSSVFKLLLNLIPIIMAVLVVKWRSFRPKGYLLFATLFFSSFVFLTLLRFILDPDFITDWVGFGLEIQLGLSLLAGYFISSLSRFKVLFILFIVILLNCYIVSNLAIKQFSNLDTRDYQSKISNMLKNNVRDGERVFLSGSSVFWINSKININQIRGGVDQGSIHPFWAHGAYQIREGEDEKLAKSLLSIFGASYILVHDKNSEEYYSDFKNVEKFNKKINADFEQISTDKGDILYKIKGTSIGRTAYKDILKIQKPKGGNDRKSIYSYASLLKNPIDITFDKPDMLRFSTNTRKDEIISLAISYDKRWKITKGEGKIIKDSFGNILVLPGKLGEQTFELSYKLFWYDFGTPIAGSIVLILVILNYQSVSPVIKRRINKLNFGIHDEEDY